MESNSGNSQMRNFLPLYLSASITSKRKPASSLPACSLSTCRNVLSRTTKNVACSVNPARDVRRIKYATNGFHTWTVAEVAQFIERHPIGTKPYLALCLLLFIGMRGGDMVKLGRQHTWRGLLRFVPGKTKHVRVDVSEKPILPPLAAAIEAGPTGDLTFLVTEYGKPFAVKGFQNWFRARCDEAGLKQCTAHGLRKAGATILAENGATTAQLMAIYDWSTPGQAEVYIRAANRTRLAGQAMPLLTKWTEGESSFVAPASPALSHRS